MNHTYEETYKNARAMWAVRVARFLEFITEIDYFLDTFLNKFGIPRIFGEHKHKYVVYEAYIDDVNKHKKKIDGQGNSIFFRICFSFNKICNLFVLIYKMFCIEKM